MATQLPEPHDSLPRYRRTPFVSGEANIDIALWDAARASHNQKRFRESVIETIASLCPEALPANARRKNPIELRQPHGSTRIHIVVDDERFRIEAPLVRIDKANRVAALRRVAEVNFRPLTLPQIVLSENELRFEYEAPLELCHPNKVRSVVQEVCFFADDLDDEFIANYGATPCETPEVAPLSPKEAEAVVETLREIGEDYNRYLRFFEEKLQDGLQWAITTIALLRIANIPTLHGTARSRLRTQIETAYNPASTERGRIDGPKKFLGQLFAEAESGALSNDFYHATQLTSFRSVGAVPVLQQVFGEQRANVEERIRGGDLYSAAFTLQHLFIKTLYDFNLEGQHEAALQNVLVHTSGMKTGEAVEQMIPVFDHFAAGTPNRILPPQRKGFLARLFGS